MDLVNAGEIGKVVEPSAQRRTLIILVCAQVLSGAGLAAGITVGALLAQDMLGTTSLAGLPTALFTIGSAVAALTIGRVSQRAGRRPGLALGYLIGALGSLGVVVAAAMDNVPLVFVALFVYGSGTATNLQARYAGADLASPARRGRAVSTVLVATTLGAVVGPNLVTVMGGVATAWGIPSLAGPFILAAAAYGSAGLVLLGWLRPDPLLLARAMATSADSAAQQQGTIDDAAPRRGMVALAALIMVVTQLVMAGIMTMTPVHMRDHGHTVGAAGLVIAIHVGAMYLPSPVSGWLVDRFGPRVVAAAAGLTLLASGIVGAIAPVESTAMLTVALALLGLGWSFGLISGTAMLTNALPLSTRAKTQGAVDLCIALAGAGGGMASGIVVASASFAALSVAGGLIAVATVPVIALASMKGRTSHS